MLYVERITSELRAGDVVVTEDCRAQVKRIYPAKPSGYWIDFQNLNQAYKKVQTACWPADAFALVEVQEEITL